jgi:hypothetical protein
MPQTVGRLIVSRRQVIEPVERLLLFSSIAVSGRQSDAPHEVCESRI